MVDKKDPDQTPGRQNYSGKQSRLRINFICGIVRRCGRRANSHNAVRKGSCGDETRGRSHVTASIMGWEHARFMEEPGEAEGSLSSRSDEEWRNPRLFVLFPLVMQSDSSESSVCVRTRRFVRCALCD